MRTWQRQEEIDWAEEATVYLRPRRAYVAPLIETRPSSGYNVPSDPLGDLRIRESRREMAPPWGSRPAERMPVYAPATWLAASLPAGAEHAAAACGGWSSRANPEVLEDLAAAPDVAARATEWQIWAELQVLVQWHIALAWAMIVRSRWAHGKRTTDRLHTFAHAVRPEWFDGIVEDRWFPGPTAATRVSRLDEAAYVDWSEDATVHDHGLAEVSLERLRSIALDVCDELGIEVARVPVAVATEAEWSLPRRKIEALLDQIERPEWFAREPEPKEIKGASLARVLEALA